MPLWIIIFHVLVRVSRRAREISTSELIRRFKILYPEPTDHQMFTADEFAERLENMDSDACQLRKQLLARMGDVSEFMRTLKQRFSIWYNKNYNRFGPLWSDRFKSAVIENDPSVMSTVAAYIDLNAMRAGIVKDPKDYPFCGYNEALAGHESLQRGIVAILGSDCLENALSDYRMILFGKGAIAKPDGHGAIIDPRDSREVAQTMGKLSREELLRHRLRFMSNGLVIGSSEFVATFIEKWGSRINDAPTPAKANRTHTPSSYFNISTCVRKSVKLRNTIL